MKKYIRTITLREPASPEPQFQTSKTVEAARLKYRILCNQYLLDRATFDDVYEAFQDYMSTFIKEALERGEDPSLITNTISPFDI